MRARLNRQIHDLKEILRQKEVERLELRKHLADAMDRIKKLETELELLATTLIGMADTTRVFVMGLRQEDGNEQG